MNSEAGSILQLGVLGHRDSHARCDISPADTLNTWGDHVGSSEKLIMLFLAIISELTGGLVASILFHNKGVELLSIKKTNTVGVGISEALGHFLHEFLHLRWVLGELIVHSDASLFLFISGIVSPIFKASHGEVVDSGDAFGAWSCLISHSCRFFARLDSIIKIKS